MQTYQRFLPCVIFFYALLPFNNATSTEPDKVAVAKSLELLRKAAKGHIEMKSCFGCHNQAFPMLAFSKVKDKNFTIPKEEIEAQTNFIMKFLEINEQKFLEGAGTGGAADTAGYALFTLELAGVKPNQTTNAVVTYLLKHQADNGYWKVTSNRPPSEASHFTTNFLALRALRVWGKSNPVELIEKRRKAASDWVIKTLPKTTEDLVFRILALQEISFISDKQIVNETLKQSAKALIDKQNNDGGWAQTEKMESDPYATATSLVALHMTGQVLKNDKVFQEGINYLVKTRKEDGSWLVKSHSKPFQTYYESGFPHEKDQFISVTASGWATAAMLISLSDK